MDKIVTLSNQAVSLLEDGEHHSALLMLKEAIQQLRSATREHPLCHDSSKCTPPGCDAGFKNVPIPNFLKGEAQVPCSFVHRSAVTIPLPGSQEYVSEKWCHRKCSAMVLYNAALAFHLRSCIQSDGTTFFITKSLQLYEMAYTLLKSLDQTDLTVLRTRVLMAILNNIGHCYFELGSYDISRQFLDRLLSIVKSTEQIGFPDEELELYMLNIMVLKEPPAASAA